jgi:hypothetical protein
MQAVATTGLAEAATRAGILQEAFAFAWWTSRPAQPHIIGRAKRLFDQSCGCRDQDSRTESCVMLHRTRHLFVRQQNAVINSIGAHLAEFRVAPVGRNGVEELLDVAADPNDDRVPEAGRDCIAALGAQLRMRKFSISSDASCIGIGPMRQVSGWTQYWALGLRWRPHSLPAFPTRKLFHCGGTSSPGLAWFPSRTPAVTRKAW